MAFMQGWSFQFVYKDESGNLYTSSCSEATGTFATVDDLFKNKNLGESDEKSYFVVKEGVYSYSKYHSHWTKCK